MIMVNGAMPTYTIFPNGELNVSLDDSAIKEAKEIQKLDITWRFRDNSDFIKLGTLLSYLHSFEDLKWIAVQVTILYLPYERMDRYEIGSNNAFSLAVVAQFLSTFDVTYTLVEPHTKGLLEIPDDGGLYLGVDSVKYPSVVKTKELLSGLNSGNKRNLLVFPDKGALERYKDYDFYNCDIVVGHKSRDFETHKITDLYVTTLDDKRVDDLSEYDQAIIIDDLISYGGTFTRLGAMLKDQGVSGVTLVVCHAEDSIFKGSLLAKDSPIDTVWATESMTNLTAKAQFNNKLKVYSFLQK